MLGIIKASFASALDAQATRFARDFAHARHNQSSFASALAYSQNS